MTPVGIAKIVGAAAGALALSGAVVFVTASAAGVSVTPFAAASPAPTPSPGTRAAGRQAFCQDFFDHLASDLGKKPADVWAAGQKALGQTLDDAVKQGKLTQQQADQIKQKAAGTQLCDALPGLARHGAGGHEAGAGLPGLQRSFIADAAKALSMAPQDLQSQIRSGRSLMEIAAAKGMNEQQFRDAFAAAVKADLDQQVKSGKLTQQQEDAILNRVKNGPLPFWNGRPAGPRPAPSASTTTG